MEYKSFQTNIKIVNEREVAGVPSVFGNIDNGGDRIFSGAFKKTLKESGKRIKHLWQHDYALPPTAFVKDLHEVSRNDLTEFFPGDMPEEVSGGLVVVREYLRTPRADEILEGIKTGAITEMSFAYDPVKFDFEEAALGEEGRFKLVRNLRELRLWETSDVLWGMNSLTVASKSAVPYRDTGKASEDETWSAPGLGDMCDGMWDDQGTAEKKRIMSHYAFSANMPPEAFSDLKLPHHQPSKTGVGPAVWRGVAAAMGALLGARGGVSIPASDRRAVYDHLASHYAQFDKEPPDYKLIEMVSLANEISPIYEKVGRVLSTRNLEKLKEALAVLAQILENAEPIEEEDEKTASPEFVDSLFKRLSAVERDSRIRNSALGVH